MQHDIVNEKYHKRGIALHAEVHKVNGNHIKST